MNQQILIVPDWVVRAVHWVEHNWTVVVGVLIVAVLASVFVEVIKRRYNAKQEEAMAKHIVAWLLVVFSTLFSWLAYAIFYTQNHTSLLDSLPVIGSHTTEALGLAYTLYAVRLSTWYRGFAAWASRWTGQKAVESTIEPEAPVVSVPPVTEVKI